MKSRSKRETWWRLPIRGSFRTWIAASVVALAAAGCSDPVGPEEDALEAAMARWAEAAPDAYTFRLQRSCFCASEFLRPVQIEVVFGEVTFAYFADDREPILTPLPAVPTIDDLFLEVRSAINRDADRILAEYDATFGFPISVSIDFDFQTIDEEMVFFVSHFDVASIAN